MHVHGLMRLMLAKTEAFRLPLVIIDGDVKSAFASLTVAELAVALTELQLPACLQVALLAEYENMGAAMTIVDAPASAPFAYTRGGREGGRDTHSLWMCFFPGAHRACRGSVGT